MEGSRGAGRAVTAQMRMQRVRDPCEVPCLLSPLAWHLVVMGEGLCVLGLTGVCFSKSPPPVSRWHFLSRPACGFSRMVGVFQSILAF